MLVRSPLPYRRRSARCRRGDSRADGHSARRATSQGRSSERSNRPVFGAGSYLAGPRGFCDLRHRDTTPGARRLHPHQASLRSSAPVTGPPIERNVESVISMDLTSVLNRGVSTTPLAIGSTSKRLSSRARRLFTSPCANPPAPPASSESMRHYQSPLPLRYSPFSPSDINNRCSADNDRAPIAATTTRPTDPSLVTRLARRRARQSPTDRQARRPRPQTASAECRRRIPPLTSNREHRSERSADRPRSPTRNGDPGNQRRPSHQDQTGCAAAAVRRQRRPPDRLHRSGSKPHRRRRRLDAPEQRQQPPVFVQWIFVFHPRLSRCSASSLRAR